LACVWPDELAEAIEVIGPSGTRWLLALDDDPLGDLAETVAGLSYEQRTALETLSQLIGQAASLAGPGRQAISSLIGQQLVGHPAVAAVPPALALRRASGGSLPVSPETEDGLAESAGTMAVQLLGAYLVDPALHHDGMGSPFSASVRFDDPVVQGWCAQMLADPELGAPFGGARRVAVPAVIGIAGLTLPPGTSITIDEHATLRAVTPLERQLLGQVGGGQVETVLTTTFDYRLCTEREDPGPWLREHGTAAFAALDEVTVRARAAVILGTHALDVGSAAVVATLIHTPLSFTPAISSYLGRPRTPMHDVTDDECRAISARAQAMATVSLDRIDVAVRRLLSALERPTATDGFIDAVIGWDNLFGSRRATRHCAFRCRLPISRRR